MKIQNVKALLLVRAGNYNGYPGNDKGLKPAGRLQAVNIAKTISTKVTGETLIISGTELRMSQTSEIMAETLDCETISDQDLNHEDSSRYYCSLSGLIQSSLKSEILKHDNEGTEILIFVGYTDILDGAVRSLSHHFPDNFPNGLKQPKEGPSYGSGFCANIGEGEAWFVDIEEKEATVIGHNASETIMKPGDIIQIPRKK